MRKFISLSAAFLALSFLSPTYGAVEDAQVQTQRQYLSGHGCDDMVQWDFLCTDGRNSGEWTTIGVPSCWELQGFGTYQYGMRFYGRRNPAGIAREEGHYRYEFRIPQEWEGRHIELIFEAVMTECQAQINGRKAVGSHQGGFYRITADVSDRIYYGNKPNLLEVTVKKEADNEQVNLAERRADYWNFGGIIRPVFLISKPALFIDRTAIHATMDGRFQADVLLGQAQQGAKVRTEILDAQGKVVAQQQDAVPEGGDRAAVVMQVSNPALWSAETPVRYTARFTLLNAQGKALHQEKQPFGFRTIETRASDGLYINGHRINVRGVNRHSFRPETGRTLSYQKNLEDVQLIKSMNMNAVRLSHYPADPEFLDICDSLGLYVMEELSGWHWAHETVTGQKLVKEMITRDVNHPSIIWWSNGNEGGFNYELEPEFRRWDPQQRTVIYPWSNRNGYETVHYRSYGESQDFMRKPELFMPTEFLHGLYDGGHGAGLYDYWQMMYSHPRCVGGFLWDLSDEGVVRVDEGGRIDNVGNFGADGIVGPHFEKEGSYWTIRQLWCPVQPDLQSTQTKGGMLQIPVENRYDFRNLRACTFKYEYLEAPAFGLSSDLKAVATGKVKGPDVPCRGKGVISVPSNTAAHILRLTCEDADGADIMTWSVVNPARSASASTLADLAVKGLDASQARFVQDYGIDGHQALLQHGGTTVTFSDQTGLVTAVSTKNHKYSLTGGPRFVAARRADRSLDQFYNHDDAQAEKKKTQYKSFDDQGQFAGFRADGDGRLTVMYRLGSLDSVCYQLASDGRLLVEAYYNFQGVVDVMGVAFDYPETQVKSKRWLGQGPYRVWKNRMHGPQYGLWSNDYNDPIPGESFLYPEFKGYYAGTDWMELQTTEGRIGVANLQPEADCVGVYQPRDGRDELLYTLPATGLSLLRVIPAVRNKVNTTDLNGPSAQPVWARGSYVARFVLSFE